MNVDHPAEPNPKLLIRTQCWLFNLTEQREESEVHINKHTVITGIGKRLLHLAVWRFAGVVGVEVDELQ